MQFLDFRTALDRLAPDHREALILVGASGLSYEDAAALCGCAVGTMKSRVNRARARLGKCWRFPSDNHLELRDVGRGGRCIVERQVPVAGGRINNVAGGPSEGPAEAKFASGGRNVDTPAAAVPGQARDATAGGGRHAGFRHAGARTQSSGQKQLPDHRQPDEFKEADDAARPPGGHPLHRRTRAVDVGRLTVLVIRLPVRSTEVSLTDTDQRGRCPVSARSPTCRRKFAHRPAALPTRRSVWTTRSRWRCIRRPCFRRISMRRSYAMAPSRSPPTRAPI